MARLAALIPRPGVNLTRYHGVLAPNSAVRALVTPAGRGKRVPGIGPRAEPDKRRAMIWARRLKRVFKKFNGGSRGRTLFFVSIRSGQRKIAWLRIPPWRGQYLR